MDDTPVHKAVREALVNTLVNADYYGRQGLVVQKYPDKFVFANPGSFRIPLKDALDGGTSDPRNATILKMFSMLDIGERAGSGIPGIVAVWEENFNVMPRYVQTANPSRVRTMLDVAGISGVRKKMSDIVEKANDKTGGTSDNIEFQAINETSSNRMNQKREDVKALLLGVFKDSKEHSVSELAKIVKLSMPRTRMIISELVADGEIVSEGANKNRVYKLATGNSR